MKYKIIFYIINTMLFILASPVIIPCLLIIAPFQIWHWLKMKAKEESEYQRIKKNKKES